MTNPLFAKTIIPDETEKKINVFLHTREKCNYLSFTNHKFKRRDRNEETTFRPCFEKKWPICQ